ncbi:MAG TPA: hypothetical protein VEH80_05835 [Candidatus Bathyarchaeia archaeon]|nr:hypothetical protein [Candidatus Bathyarchaeia archaeon]
MTRIALMTLASLLVALAAAVGLDAYTARDLPISELAPLVSGGPFDRPVARTEVARRPLRMRRPLGSATSDPSIRSRSVVACGNGTRA